MQKGRPSRCVERNGPLEIGCPVVWWSGAAHGAAIAVRIFACSWEASYVDVVVDAGVGIGVDVGSVGADTVVHVAVGPEVSGDASHQAGEEVMATAGLQWCQALRKRPAVGPGQQNRCAVVGCSGRRPARNG